MNPHIRALQSIALVGVMLGVILTVIGMFNYQAAMLLPFGVAILILGALAFLLQATAQAITWKPGDK